jgi:hypothetical protein
MPLRHRTHSAAISAASDWIFNFLVVQITPVAIANIRWKTYMIFFVLNIVFAIAVWLFYPETAGRSLEEIDAIFMGENDRVVVVDRRGRLLPGFRRKSLLAAAATGLDPEMARPSKDDVCHVDHREDSGENEKA